MRVRMKIRWNAVILSTFIWIFCFAKGASAEADRITSFSASFYIPAMAVETGGSEEDIRAVLSDVSCKAFTGEGNSFRIPISWDCSQVCFSAAGAYRITGSPVIPEEYEVECGLPSFSAQVSVQNAGQPDINAFSEMKSAGLFYFPWLTRSDAGSMTVWLKKDGEGWADASEEYALCDTDGMYLSGQSMIPGNVYTLMVQYGQSFTRQLRFLYRTDRSISVYSYEWGSLGDVEEEKKVIASVEDCGNYGMERILAAALPVGGDFSGMIAELERSVFILANTTDVYEDTAAHPCIKLESVWDTSGVNMYVPGVYKIRGTFAVPEGYEKKEGLELPETAAFLSVQEPGKPRLNTYYMPLVILFEFPMLLDGFTQEEIDGFRVFLKENGGEYRDITGKGCYFSEEGLFAERETVFREGCSYEMYVSWEDGDSGVYRFEYGEDFITNDSWYERNYSDRDGVELPETEQGDGADRETGSTSEESGSTDRETGSTSEESGSADRETGSASEGSDTAAGEAVTETKTVISKERLEVLIENAEEFVSFEKNGILLKIPSEILQQEMPEQTSVEIISMEDGTISVSIVADGRELQEIPGAVLEIPVKNLSEEDGGEMIITDENGDELETGSDPDTGILDVFLNETGSIRAADGSAKAASAEPASAEPESPAAKRSGIVAVFLAAAAVWWRKSRNGSCSG